MSIPRDILRRIFKSEPAGALSDEARKAFADGRRAKKAGNQRGVPARYAGKSDQIKAAWLAGYDSRRVQ